MNISNIPARYRTQLNGALRNIHVNYCCECDTKLFNVQGDQSANMEGFAEWLGCVVVVRECPKCFTRQWSHVRDLDYANMLIDFKEKRL